MPESTKNRTGPTAWLTGVFVPAEQYTDVRDAMLQVSVDALRRAGMDHPCLELHGVKMLRTVSGATDEHRLEVFEQVVRLVNKERLPVLSAGAHGVQEEARAHRRATR